jgi:hypothetical protein
MTGEELSAGIDICSTPDASVSTPTSTVVKLSAFETGAGVGVAAGGAGAAA